MANPTGQELRDAVALIAERIGYGKLHERLMRLNAFVSRRKPPTPAVLADRLYTLTSGLRRQVPATLAFHTVWSEAFGRDLGEDNDKKLEAIADRINATLTPDERAVREGQAAELDAAIGEYEAILSGAIGPRAARLDMLLKAVAPVAELLRQRPLPVPGEQAPPPVTGEEEPRSLPATSAEAPVVGADKRD